MKYALELIQDTGIGGAKPTATPLEHNTKLTTVEYDHSLQQENKGEDYSADKAEFQRLIGRLLYLKHTRSDIAFSVQHLSQFMNQPKKEHMEAALRVVRYIKNNPRLGIILKASSSCQLVASCGSDWATCLMTRKSVTGFCVKLRDSLVSW
ncbi:uncharacterized mitochondrial protein AtMg00240-like [Hibiscus syriacus]|uniref:uncharacterized mitochondrial protein AtMg00240-like n=1 Tax=Hibiscus syriacus TaxID=106335 RepID=UPI001923A69A|nr:uncharacterized mitochondrial protein AtMg00240-like [Hibiscus syriacus]